MSKYYVGFKTLLLQGLSESEFYGDLVYKFTKLFPYHFKKITVRYFPCCYLWEIAIHLAAAGDVYDGVFL